MNTDEVVYIQQTLAATSMYMGVIGGVLGSAFFALARMVILHFHNKK